MPIYQYTCQACHHSCELLQKMSDPVATTCPNCQKDTLKKQVTAASFHLKGTGWYVTDFKDKKASSTQTPSSSSKKTTSESSQNKATASESKKTKKDDK